MYQASAGESHQTTACCGDFTAADAQEHKLLQLKLPLIWSQNPFCSRACVNTKPPQLQDLFLPTLFHLVTTMSPSRDLFHLKFSSHAYLKTLILEASKPMFTLTNICRDLHQLFQPHIRWILQINTKAFSNAHCLLLQTIGKQLFFEVRWYFNVDASDL